MKFIAVIALSLCAFGAMASERSVEDTIASLESDRMVKCDFVKNSFEFCYGGVKPFNTCRYTTTYSCNGHESFKAELKIKSTYNHRANKRETSVTKVTIK